jgi:hypothetical protein
MGDKERANRREPTILAQPGTYDVVIGNACGSAVSARDPSF